MEYVVNSNIKLWEENLFSNIPRAECNNYGIPCNSFSSALCGVNTFAVHSEHFYPSAYFFNQDLISIVLIKFAFETEMGYSKVCIKGIWYPIIPLRKLIRSPNKEDGYFRYLYIQINFENGHYYIGKSNRPTYRDVRNYKGSGLRFRKEYNKHPEAFHQFFFALCKTARETEELEASIVDETLLTDENCLNLVHGGAGVSYHPQPEETRAKISRIQKRLYQEHPERLRPMLDASHAVHTNEKRRETLQKKMNSEKYKQMTSERMKQWRKNNPEAYKEALKKSAEVNRTLKSRENKRKAHAKWAKENPEKWAIKQLKMKIARETPEAIAKRKASLKRFQTEHPKEASENMRKRVEASIRATSKPICMLDPLTNKVLKVFPSISAAAWWLVEQKKAPNHHCQSTINGVLVKKTVPGHGVHQTAYGYKWIYKGESIGEPRQLVLSFIDSEA